MYVKRHVRGHSNELFAALLIKMAIDEKKALGEKPAAARILLIYKCATRTNILIEHGHRIYLKYNCACARINRNYAILTKLSFSRDV